jgi:hypothetical protein
MENPYSEYFSNNKNEPDTSNTTSNDIDSEDLVEAVVSSDGNIPLATERLNTTLRTNITEYKLRRLITKQSGVAKSISEQLRTLMIIRVFDMLINTQNDILSRIDEIPAKDLASFYGRLLSGFNQLTAPSVKDLFDITDESRKVAEELGIPIKEVEQGIKELEKKLSGKA